MEVSIHALLAECDPGVLQQQNFTRCFNPRTPCGVRRKLTVSRTFCQKFQSTHSLRSATITTEQPPSGFWQFQSTHSLRSATGDIRKQAVVQSVSIHALLAECDQQSGAARGGRKCFNPRTPCGVRLSSKGGKNLLIKFQSTHSLRSATCSGMQVLTKSAVSIHALLAECDMLHGSAGNLRKRFNPRTPCGVRPKFGAAIIIVDKVSIHALLAECDRPVRLRPDKFFCFNPRTPCGVRQGPARTCRLSGAFQSTHSLRSATRLERIVEKNPMVSIHALLAECDHAVLGHALLPPGFNPRTPCGVRPNNDAATCGREKFQSTHSLRSATPTGELVTIMETVSIHALLAECDIWYR